MYELIESVYLFLRYLVALAFWDRSLKIEKTLSFDGQRTIAGNGIRLAG